MLRGMVLGIPRVRVHQTVCQLWRDIFEQRVISLGLHAHEGPATARPHTATELHAYVFGLPERGHTLLQRVARRRGSRGKTRGAGAAHEANRHAGGPWSAADTRATRSGGVIRPTIRPSMTATGARPQLPRQRASVADKRPSGVVSPSRTANASARPATSWRAPRM